MTRWTLRKRLNHSAYLLVMLPIGLLQPRNYAAAWRGTWAGPRGDEALQRRVEDLVGRP